MHKDIKLVYVAGPFRAANQWLAEQNKRRAEEVAVELWRAGYSVICPHANTRYMDGIAPDEVFLAGDLVQVERCDAVVVVHGWKCSKGTLGEIEHAIKCGIPVMYWHDSIYLDEPNMRAKILMDMILNKQRQ